MPSIYFQSSNGTRFNLKEFSGCKLKEADFHKYSWGRAVTQKQFGEVLDRFTKDAQLYTAKIIFKGNPAERKAQVEQFHFETERDITNQSIGRIYWGQGYIECYVVDSDTYPSSDNPLWTENDVTFYCPYPFWIEEQVIEVTPSEESIISTDKGYREADNLGYPYPYSYATAPNVSRFYVDHYAPSEFKMIGYGPFYEFYVNIAGNVYNVNYPVRANQYLTIDSRQSTPADRRCFVTSESGIKTNVFDYRNPDYSLFTPIPGGANLINYVRDYGLELTIYKERSEPR
jgi:hypothetical protein